MRVGVTNARVKCERVCECDECVCECERVRECERLCGCDKGACECERVCGCDECACECERVRECERLCGCDERACECERVCECDECVCECERLPECDEHRVRRSHMPSSRLLTCVPQTDEECSDACALVTVFHRRERSGRVGRRGDGRCVRV